MWPLYILHVSLSVVDLLTHFLTPIPLESRPDLGSAQTVQILRYRKEIGIRPWDERKTWLIGWWIAHQPLDLFYSARENERTYMVR